MRLRGHETQRRVLTSLLVSCHGMIFARDLEAWLEG